MRYMSLLRAPAAAASHASWLYPLKGIYYFAAHPFLYRLLKARLIPCALLSLFVFSNLFFWTYLPQVACLALFHARKLAWINGVFLVLGEGSAITALLFEAFLVDETLVDVHDAVLVNEGCRDLVATSRVLDPDAADAVLELGKPTVSAVYSPFSLRQIVEFIILLPLNFIPVAGTPVFLILTGRRAGPLHHWRYFKLLGLTKKERNAHVRRQKLRYTWFGTVALLLQLIPVLSMLFLLTTAAGSALWVVKIEESKRLRSQSMEGDGTFPHYVDNPV